MDDDAGRWFLSRAERGNLATDVHAGGAGSPSWSEGNLVRPLIHGATYFARLHEELTALRAGDRVWFTDWRGDPDELLDAWLVREWKCGALSGDHTERACRPPSAVDPTSS